MRLSFNAFGTKSNRSSKNLSKPRHHSHATLRLIGIERLENRQLLSADGLGVYRGANQWYLDTDRRSGTRNRFFLWACGRYRGDWRLAGRWI